MQYRLRLLDEPKRQAAKTIVVVGLATFKLFLIS
jgi:hypothetical protein